MVFFGGACPMLLHVKHETRGQGGIKRFGITGAPKQLSSATCQKLGSESRRSWAGGGATATTGSIDDLYTLDLGLDLLLEHLASR